MQSRTTRQFWRLFSDLPFDVQQDARRAYRLFQSNPAHPGLQFKKLEGEDDIYSARIVPRLSGARSHEEGTGRLVLDRQSLRLRPAGLNLASCRSTWSLRLHPAD